MNTTDDLVEVFVDAGLVCVEQGVAGAAARTFAERLVAEGHGQALSEITAAFWTANEGRKARRERWAASARERAALDPGEKEPPPPPPQDPPPPDEEPPPPPPPTDSSSAPTAVGTEGE